jgi:hypothetical protein
MLKLQRGTIAQPCNSLSASVVVITWSTGHSVSIYRWIKDITLRTDTAIFFTHIYTKYTVHIQMCGGWIVGCNGHNNYWVVNESLRIQAPGSQRIDSDTTTNLILNIMNASNKKPQREVLHNWYSA